MKFQPINIIKVFYSADSPNAKPLLVGKIALKDHQFFFEYDDKFLQRGLQLSPFQLPLKSGLLACKDRVFDGLFGVFNDSLPDGWGRLLLDRKLMSLGINSQSLTMLDRLRFVGADGMGALTYEPEMPHVASTATVEILDHIADDCIQFQKQESDEYIDDLLAMNGSSGGARPKVMMQYRESALKKPESRPELWIVKFRSSLDAIDIGPIEYAYHEMARHAGIEVPEARLFPSKNYTGYFGVKRFDRLGEQRIHMHTASGLLHADHRLPSLDYESLLKATLWLTRDFHECEKQFRQAVFNVLAHNRDDHAKNFSYLMSSEGVWKVSPAYDLTFSSGPSGEHCTSIMGEAKRPTEHHLLKLAESVSIKKESALQMIEQTKEAIIQWPIFAENAGVSKRSLKHIQTALKAVIREF